MVKDELLVGFAKAVLVWLKWGGNDDPDGWVEAAWSHQGGAPGMEKACQTIATTLRSLEQHADSDVPA